MSLRTAGQLRAARALVRLQQSELAERSGVSLPTIKRLEAGEGPLAARLGTVDKLAKALEALGVAFIEENGGGPGVRARGGLV